MRKIELLKMAENPNLIRGIFNYCDRWCERCAFTRRCLTYAMEKEMSSDQEGRDINNEKFWKDLQCSFDLTIDLLTGYMKERGIDPNEIDLDAGDEEEEEDFRMRAEENPAVRAAKNYATMVTDWIERQEDVLKEKENILMRELELGLADTEATATSIVDALEVIRWYQLQIAAKLLRALEGEDEERYLMEDEEIEDIPKDSDGSAKVALMGIDRSLAAWGELQKRFPEQYDNIMKILIHLCDLMKSIERLFPNARRFVRPGFEQEV